MLQNISNERSKRVLSCVERLTEEKVDEVVKEFLRDYKKESPETKYAAYTVSKAAMNAYTRILAERFPRFRINCVCPGYVKTDINRHTGTLTVEETAPSLVSLATLSDDGPSGLFFARQELSCF